MSISTDMKHDINDMVTVTLTKKAMDILDAKYRNYSMTPFKLDGNTLTTKLWSIMNIFGSYMYMGCEQLFVDNVIVFKEKNGG